MHVYNVIIVILGQGALIPPPKKRPGGIGLPGMSGGLLAEMQAKRTSMQVSVYTYIQLTSRVHLGKLVHIIEDVQSFGNTCWSREILAVDNTSRDNKTVAVVDSNAFWSNESCN